MLFVNIPIENLIYCEYAFLFMFSNFRNAPYSKTIVQICYIPNISMVQHILLTTNICYFLISHNKLDKYFNIYIYI